MLSLPIGTHSLTLPACPGTRGMVFLLPGGDSVNLLPSTGIIYEVGVAPIRCSQCGDLTVPEEHPYDTEQEWYLPCCNHPCYACYDVTNEPTCSNCDYCMSCCTCSFCEDCEVSVTDTRTIDGREICDSCLGSYVYCEQCGQYVSEYDADDHYHGCDCEPSEPRFTFPNGTGEIVQDQRVTIALPTGMVSEAGKLEVSTFMRNAVSDGLLEGITCSRVEDVVWDLDTAWQTKEGNYPKRLAKVLYKLYKIKVSSSLLSEIGNIASRHVVKADTYHLEVTRDLNNSADAFYHSGSCWWSEYAVSRCALKQWGGIGLRSYRNEDDHSDHPTGRVWIQPLDADLMPTGEAMKATAYLVYNGYGDLSGYTAARLVASMVGMTYGKVSLSLNPQYVNGSSGYLVSDPKTVSETTSIRIRGDAHTLPSLEDGLSTL